MPLPLNHRTYRLSIAGAGGGSVRASAAYAVPWELNMATSGGTPTMIGVCAAVRPFRKILRDSLLRFVITRDIHRPPGELRGLRRDQIHHQLFKTKIRPAKYLCCFAKQWPV